MPPPSAPHPALSAGALAAIYAHARREYPRECCGVVRGPRGQATADQVTACENIQDRLHAENPARFIRTARTAYNLDARDILALRESLGGDSPARIVYHSHVDAGSYFSEADQAVAQRNGEPTYPVEYVVVDIRADGPRGATQFAWDAGQRKFLEVGAYVCPLERTS
ncbi:Mov34/MPN/PAD-1 family protein [Corallococcus terminator]